MGRRPELKSEAFSDLPLPVLEITSIFVEIARRHGVHLFWGILSPECRGGMHLKHSGNTPGAGGCVRAGIPRIDQK